MRQFFKFVFASCLGVFLAFVLVFVVLFSIMGVLVSGLSTAKPEKISPNSALLVELNQMIPEKTDNVPLNPFAFKQESVLGLHDIVELIQKAADDKNIKLLYLNLNSSGLGNVTARNLREAILQFKESGKPVIAYAHAYSQSNYYLASAADKIYLNPIGNVSFEGFGVIIPFFKNMLDKLGIEMQVYYAGQFKSATEPFRYDKMSEQNRLQTKEFLDQMYRVFLSDISTSRNLSIDSLHQIADQYLSRNADSALALGLIDGIKYEDEVIDELKSLIGLNTDDKLKLVSLNTYFTANPKTDLTERSKSKVAVVYAEGEINDGAETPGEVNGDQYVKILRKINKDKNVKAVVLRINSPGGSVLASERILRELQLIKDKNIPVVVSMGDVAASGGYYIACASDKIFAESNTITGSIGVFTLLPNVQKLMNQKLGITFDTVKTNKYATSFNALYKLNADESEIIQKDVEKIYERFLTIVSNARSMDKNAVHEIAQGRVWTGSKAKEIGLVDEIGGLQEALNYAAQLAEIDSYKITSFPRTKDPLEQLLEQLTSKSGDDILGVKFKKWMGPYHPIYQQLLNLSKEEGLQARLPFYPLMN